MLDFNRQEDTENAVTEVKQLVKAGLLVMVKYESGTGRRASDYGLSDIRKFYPNF